MRQFFYDRQFVEVETPLLAREVIPELHIEPMASATGYLQASPELHMKRLVAAGMEAIFQVTRSFRGNERGVHHHPEFTILEWYRAGDDLQAGMELLGALCQTLLATPPPRQTRYAAAFQTHVDLCPHTATLDQLAARSAALGLPTPTEMPDRDAWLELLLTLAVEPHLGRDVPELLYDYPASQAALAATAERAGGIGDTANIEVAERFELYWQGVELANGYHELTDPVELRRRLEQVNHQRSAAGRAALPLPESLLTAMETGLPPCAGCALGFDRLVMLATGATSIAEVQAFSE
jgi:lysyl-tRNA synthetase class 2